MSCLSEKLKTQKDFFARKPVTDVEIADAEHRLSVKFSDEYKSYIAALGAATIHGHELTGICANKNVNVVDATIHAREMDVSIPASFYLIENTHYDGILIWQDTNGSVYSSIPTFGMKRIASSIAEYLKI